MKNKIQQLVKVGLSKELLKNLSEGQINQLHNRMISEQVNVSKSDTTMINKLKSEKKPFQVYEKEIDEDDTVEKDPFELSSTQDKRQVGPSSYGDNPTVDKEMDNDDADGMGMMETEIGEEKKKKSKYNPWAICTSSVGREDKDKFERCVKDVKRNVREGKNPHQVIVEMALEKMIEKFDEKKDSYEKFMKIMNEFNFEIDSVARRDLGDNITVIIRGFDSNNDVVRTKVSNPNYFLKNMNIDIDDFRDFLYNPKKYF